MTQHDAIYDTEQGEPKLPRRDWILLPMVGLLTICLLVGSTELIARCEFSHSLTSVYNCIVQDDPTTGFRAIPGSVCLEKSPEAPLVEYRFNSCGQRSKMACGPKPPGYYRILIAGSSIAMGDMVPGEETIAALLPSELRRSTGLRIDIYNEAMMQESPATVNLRFKAFIEAKPDMILWIITSWDIQHTSITLPFVVKSTDKHAVLGATRLRLMKALADKSIWEALNAIEEAISNQLGASSTKLLLQHYLYESQSQYVKSALRPGDSEEFLMDNLDSKWQRYLSEFENAYAEISVQAMAAGTPLVVVLAPDRAQVAMISMGEWPQGYDPFKLDDELRTIVTSHGGTYVSILRGYRNIPNPERYYLPVDGHPDARGHAVISELLAKELTSGSVPSLKAAQPRTSNSERDQ